MGLCFPKRLRLIRSTSDDQHCARGPIAAARLKLSRFEQIYRNALSVRRGPDQRERGMFERFTKVLPLLAIVFALVLVVADTNAATKFNAGSRGSRTYAAPPSTATSPNGARPVE